jgi:hypothetical protein
MLNVINLDLKRKDFSYVECPEDFIETFKEDNLSK